MALVTILVAGDGGGSIWTRGPLYPCQGANRVILNGASDNPGAPAMAEAVFGPGDLYTHARGPNRVILNGASDNPGAPAMAEAVFGPGDLYTHARGPNRVIS